MVENQMNAWSDDILWKGENHKLISKVDCASDGHADGNSRGVRFPENAFDEKIVHCFVQI